MFLDFTYILVIIGALLSLIASMNVKTTFNKYKKIHGSRGIRAYQAAEMILHSADIYDVNDNLKRGCVSVLFFRSSESHFLLNLNRCIISNRTR